MKFRCLQISQKANQIFDRFLWDLKAPKLYSEINGPLRTSHISLNFLEHGCWECYPCIKWPISYGLNKIFCIPDSNTKTQQTHVCPLIDHFSLVFATYVVAWQDGFDLMVANDFGHTENYAVFGVIFAFICLLSGLFSCLISVIARKGSSKNILPKYRLIIFRKSFFFTFFSKNLTSVFQTAVHIFMLNFH